MYHYFDHLYLSRGWRRIHWYKNVVEYPLAQRSQLLPQPSSSDGGGDKKKRERN